MKQVLQKIIQQPQNFAKFLNTLSLLEYIGARKILKSQHQHKVNFTILAHAAEEIRHAQVLKKIALKIEPSLCVTYHPNALLCGHEAGEYFKTVDFALGEQDPWHAYLFTTWAIEERAMQFYNEIDAVLAAMGKNTIFRGILVEEENHLNEILSELKTLPEHSNKMQKLKEVEKTAFSHFINALDKICEPA